MKITDAMIEAGARALWRASIYHGYNQETLDRQWDRMSGIWRSQSRAVLKAALNQQEKRE